MVVLSKVLVLSKLLVRILTKKLWSHQFGRRAQLFSRSCPGYYSLIEKLTRFDQIRFWKPQSGHVITYNAMPLEWVVILDGSIHQGRLKLSTEPGGLSRYAPIAAGTKKWAIMGALPSGVTCLPSRMFLGQNVVRLNYFLAFVSNSHLPLVSLNGPRFRSNLFPRGVCTETPLYEN